MKTTINKDVPLAKVKRNASIYKGRTQKNPLSYNALARIHHISPQRVAVIFKKVAKLKVVQAEKRKKGK